MPSECRLISRVDGVPHQTVAVGQTLAIGRNRTCRIRDIKCSRTDSTITFDGQSMVTVMDSKTGQTKHLSNGQLLTGTGFQYKVHIIDQNNGHTVDDHPITGTNGSDQQMSDITTDEELIAHDSTVNLDQTINDGNTTPITTTGATEWLSICSNRVHICKFLGGGRSSASIAAFDFDDTLVTPKSGQKYAVNGDDWKLIDKLLPKKIAKLVDNGFRFIVISNQLPISQGRYTLEDVQQRFEGALTAIGVPCLVMLAAFDDIYRKPRPGLWQLLVDELNNKPIDLTSSFFVGDAAGRKKQLNGKSDHSSVDLLFAANYGIAFLTPERFLSDVKPKIFNATDTSYCGFPITTYRPKKALDQTFIASRLGSDNKRYANMGDLLANYKNQLHVIVFCGLPASGKSSFYSNYLSKLGYIYISRDELKTTERCHKKCETHLRNEQNCVIDNLNVDLQARKQWVSLCNKYSALPILFYFDITVDQSLHNNKFRRIIGVNSPVTDLVIRAQNKNFVKPLATESFESIYKINFVSKFVKDEHQSLFFMYLSER